MFHPRILSLALPGLLAASSPVSAVTTNLTAVADTTLFQLFPDNNLGGNTTLAAGTIANSIHRTRPLIRFNTSGIPTNATVTTVTMTLTVTKVPGGAVSTGFSVFRMLKSWTEGSMAGLTGAAGAAGDSTWNSRARGSQSWGAPGGQAGVDYASAASTSVTMGGNGPYTFPSSAAFVEDVQAWVRNPSTNFGIILICNSEGTRRTAKRLGNREASASIAPKLIVTYTVAPTITTQPVAHTVYVGETVNLNVGASGTGLTYQWKKGSSTIPSATNAVLTFASVQAADLATYSVDVTGSSGTTTSSGAVLNVINSLRIDSHSVTGGHWMLKFTAQPLRSYVVESTPALVAQNFTPVTNITGGASAAIVTALDALTSGAKLYRVKVQPLP